MLSRPLLINAAELLRRPGSERVVDVSLTTDELGLDDPRFAPGDVLSVHLRMESLSDGIVVVGSIDIPWHGACRRCLRELAEHIVSPVDELYQSVITNPDAFEIIGDQLDLTSMVRELALLDAPLTPLCREDCAGLCPTCGVDHNEVSCDCVPATLPSPWDALDALKGQLDAN
ncbi:MAG TPA: DUF177 domain-containing protein [Ilumatobacteraceae bacterium]|jgi:uncharacterized protein